MTATKLRVIMMLVSLILTNISWWKGDKDDRSGFEKISHLDYLVSGLWLTLGILCFIQLMGGAIL